MVISIQKDPATEIRTYENRRLYVLLIGTYHKTKKRLKQNFLLIFAIIQT